MKLWPTLLWVLQWTHHKVCLVLFLLPLENAGRCSIGDLLSSHSQADAFCVFVWGGAKMGAYVSGQDNSHTVQTLEDFPGSRVTIHRRDF